MNDSMEFQQNDQSEQYNDTNHVQSCTFTDQPDVLNDSLVENHSPSVSCQTNDIADSEEKIDVRFDNDESDEEVDESDETVKPDESEKSNEPETERLSKSGKDSTKDLSKYTLVDPDNLDEDEPIRGQEFCLMSFMSPEGIMNCNVRAVKFRGAFSNIEDAKKRAKELEKKDKYFKIFIGETGKWLDFDPPSSRVEEECSSNPGTQNIINQQRKQRMKKLNDLATVTKQKIDNEDKGGKERRNESKKAGAASDAVEKQRTKKQETATKQEEKQTAKRQANPRTTAIENTKAKLKKRLADIQNNKIKAELAKEDRSGKVEDPGLQQSIEQSVRQSVEPISLDEKIKVVGKASVDLEEKKAALDAVDTNIAKIRNLMAKKRLDQK
jgi:hypothetical protein